MMSSKKNLGKIFILFAVILTICLPTSLVVNAAEVATKYEMIADLSTLDSYSKWLNKSTRYTGAVWTDKTVSEKAQRFTTDGKGNATGGLTVTPKKDNFLVDLSTMSETYAVKGFAEVPVDTVFVLDLSSSMNADMDNDKNRAEAMVEAANSSIETILAANELNRVGVVVYNGQVNGSSTTILAKLNHYTSTPSFLSIDTNSNNKITGPSGNRSMNQGTNIQLGIYEGIKMLLDATPTETIGDKTVYRSPSLVLLSDGAASYASGATTWEAPTEATIIGKGSTGSTNSEGLGFLAVMNAAYNKKEINTHYNTDSAKIYTIGVGLNTDGSSSSEGKAATVTLNPTKANLADTTNGYAKLYSQHWNDYTRKIDFQATVVNPNEIGYQHYYDFNSNNIYDEPLSIQYNDGYWASNNIDELNDAFEQITVNIEKSAGRYPTDLESEDPTQAGYIDYVDEIGEYMEVTDMRGVLTHNYFTSGSEIARMLTKDSSDLTSKERKTLSELYEFMSNRIPGVSQLNTDDIKDLISKAIDAKQISYNSKTEYSNYFAWYADEDGNFLGFCPNTEMKDVISGNINNVPSGATTIVKSYAFSNLDMEDIYKDNGKLIYLFTRVETNINTGNQVLKMRVPASLIPVTNVKIQEDSNGNPSVDDSEINIEKPFRLLYEVGLRSDINMNNFKDKLSSTYKTENKDPDVDEGYYLYTNEWDRSKEIKAKTTANFNPSTKNRFYYFNENTELYTDSSGSGRLTSSPEIGGEYYYEYIYYDYSVDNNNSITAINKTSTFIKVKVGSENGINQVTVDSIDNDEDGYFIKKGTQRISDLANLNINKDINGKIGNLTESNDSSFITIWKDGDKTEKTLLGNNGRLAYKIEDIDETDEDKDKDKDKDKKDDDKSNSSKTGDNFPLALLITLIVASIATATTILVRRYRN